MKKKSLGFRTVVLPLALVFLFFGNSKSFGQDSDVESDGRRHTNTMVIEPESAAEPDCGVNPAECSTRIFEYKGKTFTYDANAFYCLPTYGIDRERVKEGNNDPFAKQRAMEEYAERCLTPPTHIK